MAFTTYCTNKGCLKQMEPVIDKATKKVFCTECGGEVENITSFMKNQMVVMGQIKKAIGPKHSWSVKCQECSAEKPPKLGKKNELLCSSCGVELKVSKPFAEVLRQKLKNGNELK